MTSTGRVGVSSHAPGCDVRGSWADRVRSEVISERADLPAIEDHDLVERSGGFRKPGSQAPEDRRSAFRSEDPCGGDRSQSSILAGVSHVDTSHTIVDSSPGDRWPNPYGLEESKWISAKVSPGVSDRAASSATSAMRPPASVFTHFRASGQFGVSAIPASITSTPARAAKGMERRCVPRRGPIGGRVTNTASGSGTANECALTKPHYRAVTETSASITLRKRPIFRGRARISIEPARGGSSSNGTSRLSAISLRGHITSTATLPRTTSSHAARADVRKRSVPGPWTSGVMSARARRPPPSTRISRPSSNSSLPGPGPGG